MKRNFGVFVIDVGIIQVFRSIIAIIFSIRSLRDVPYIVVDLNRMTQQHRQAGPR